MTERELLERTKQFALRIFKLVAALPQTIQGKAVAAQLIRSGTSVAANHRAACRARSKPEFVAKLGIVEEEADGTAFWLELIIETELLPAAKVKPLLTEASEIVAIMASSKKNGDQIAHRKSEIGNPVKICDLTQFYSPVSGGVKRYLHEMIGYIHGHASRYEHVLIVPGAKTKLKANGRSRVYTIRSPVVSRTAQYRVLLNLRTVEEILDRERPDVIESADPYQLGWKALRVGRALRVPVVGFYHSHFPEAYVRKSAILLGKMATHRVMKLSRAYVRKLYNEHAATVVASDALGRVLRDWGVQNVRVLRLGINVEIFRPDGSGTEAVRRSLGVSSDRNLLLYVGRLAKEKNTPTLLRAFKTLQRRRPNEFHLLVIGDGPERTQLRKLQLRTDNLSWIRYCADPCDLAAFYRAADLFVHPGVQETFGLAALECQACGTPVVGIRGSYMDHVICHDQESWALENSVDGLVEAIEDCSDRKLSVMGRNAARVARSLYSWPRVFDELFCIYRELRSKYRRF